MISGSVVAAFVGIVLGYIVGTWNVRWQIAFLLLVGLAFGLWVLLVFVPPVPDW